MSKSARVRFVMSLFLLSSSACHRPVPPVPMSSSCTSATTSSEDARRFLHAGPPAFAAARTASDPMAAIANQVPGGFAGIYLRNDAYGFVVMLRDTTQRSAALAVLDTLLPRLYRRSVPVRDALVRPATWDYGELYSWQRFLWTDASLGKDMVSIGIHDSKNQIVVGATNQRGRDRILRRLSALNVPCGLVEVTGPLVPNGPSGGEASNAAASGRESKTSED